MGNKCASEKEIAEFIPANPNLYVGYNCRLWDLTNFSYIDCIVKGHNINKSRYTVYNQHEPSQVFTDIPYLYMSSRKDIRTWGDYYREGTTVLTRHTNKDTASAAMCRVKIISIHYDEYEESPLIDVYDKETGRSAHGLRPHQYNLDLKYYRVY